ncbi:MAG: hypothetical protein ACLF0P_18190 [Thermoanaerobaculia bacterium]
MTPCDADPDAPFLSAEEARIRVGTALALVELATAALAAPGEPSS